ncbi:MAG: hypothetical protein GY859_29790 [Desulfobacterales bacterium]|nr:hypothetical protein [Desulfobacterales bacterium]
MNVLVIPEDFRKDQYMLKPIIDAMMSRAGGVAKVRVCQDPLLNEPGEGRKTLALEAAKRYKTIRRKCPEMAELELRVGAWIEES